MHSLDIETRYGALRVPDTETDVIGRFLARYGEWAWDEVCFAASTLAEKGARALDVGAFVGTFGLGLAARRQLGFVCFVEANGAVAPLLADNVRRNCLSPAVVVEALVTAPGLPAADGRAEPGNMGSMSFAAEPPTILQGPTSPPPKLAMTLPELRAEHGDFDFIKLDAEGMELDILRADAEHLARGGTTIWVECNENPRSLEMADLLLSWGLELHYFAFPSHNPDNFRRDPDPIFPFAYEAGLLAAPKAPPMLDDALRAHHCLLRPVGSLADLKNALWRTPRWGRSEWLDATREELVAFAGRALRGEAFGNYLAPGWSADEPPGEELQRRLAAAEQGLRTAEALAFERLDQLGAERERRERAEEGLRTTEALAIERLDQLGAERERSRRVEAALAQASARVLDLLSKIGVERERAAAAHAAREAAEADLHEAKATVADLDRRATAAEARASDAEARAGDAALRFAEAAARLAALEASTTWRLAAPLRDFVFGHPRLHGFLRRGRRAAAAALGRR